MARCEKKVVKSEPPPAEYVLTLSETEAYVLKAVLCHGIDWRGSRGEEFLYTIHIALCAAGVPYLKSGCFVKDGVYSVVSENFDPEGWRR